MYYERIFKMLAVKKVDYLIAGGMAVNLYGVPRFTKDLDLLVAPAKANLEKLGKALKALGYKPKFPIPWEDFLDPENWEKWKREKGMVAFNLYHPSIPYEEIDILIGSPISFQEAAPRRFKIRAGGLLLHLISMEDLIRMKKVSGRAQDLADIEALKRVKRAGKSK